MPREKRTEMRVPGDIPHKIISEWEDAMREHYDVFIQMLSRGQRLELAIIAHTRLMQSGGGNILPLRTGGGAGSHKLHTEAHTDREDDMPEQWHNHGR
jgi:hypothetical protein